jgi:hypothetical protein
LGGLHQWLYVFSLKSRTEKSNVNFWDSTKNTSNGIYLKSYSL